MKKVFITLYYEILFELNPWEKTLLLLLWHRRQYFRERTTADQVLHEQLLQMERKLDSNGLSEQKHKLYLRVQNGVGVPVLFSALVEFLDSPSLDRAVLESLMWKLRKVTRFEQPPETGTKDEEGARAEVEVSNENDSGVSKIGIYARTYFIAAHLHFELAGDEGEYSRLSVQLRDLRDFIGRQFGAGKLPGRFDDFKGYSYKSVLSGKNNSEKGQLKTCFLQIVKHPEVFGTEIARMAQAILSEHFE